MGEFSQCTDTQVETLFEDWDAAEPKTNEETNFGIPTTDLFARYSFYSKLVHDRTKWEQECNQYVVDFESLLLGQTEKNIDPERMVKTFVQEKFNGEFFRLTQHPYPEDEEGDEPSIHEIDELEIPVHVIKRKAIEPREVIKPPPLQACLPLRVEDIFRIPIETQGVNTFELFGLQFRLITFYGRICKVVKNEKWNQRYGMYSVDDGSGRIVVHYNHLKKEFKETFMEIAKLENAMRLKRNKMSTRIGMISEDIRKMLQLSKAHIQLQLNYFTLGDRVMVLGVPFRNERDEVRVFGYEMYATNSADCDFEIYFKDLLFNAYCGKYFANKL